MRHAGSVGGALLAVSLAGCGGPAGGRPTASFSPPACEVVGYPCTWGEVDEAVVRRGDALGEIGMRLLLGGGSPDDVVRLLENAPSVAEVLRFDHRVRFRLTGGRPMWISPPWELDHHLPDAAAERGREIAAEEAVEPEPARSLRHHLLQLSDRLRPRPLMAASIASAWQSGGQDPRVTGEPGSGKKARVLAPFEWEFPEYGNNFSRRVRLIRDYREQAGGTVELYADLQEFGENPDDPGSSYRTARGETLLRGEVDIDDFLGWDAYHLVIVATHGTRDPCPWVLMKDLPDRKAFDTYAEYMEAIPAPFQCPSVWAGLAFREDYASYPGVEVDAFRVRRDSPNEDLTPAEAAECVQLLEAGENTPVTFGGVPCLQVGIGDKKIVVLTFEFFQWAYAKGLNDVVVFLAACRSGVNRYLLDQLTGARGGGSNRAVAAFGFAEPVNYADGFAVVDSMIRYVDEGYHSRELLRRLQAMPRVTSLVGRALAPDDVLPSRPSAIVGEEQAAAHARDVALLVDPASGEELQDGATVLVLGAGGDGKPDSLNLRARIIGVASDDPIEDVRLFVSPKEKADGPAYRPERRVEEGVFEFEGDLPLGRDHREGEIVDLEVRAELPKGGDSRWVYRDVRLRSGFWTLSVSGDIAIPETRNDRAAIMGITRRSPEACQLAIGLVPGERYPAVSLSAILPAGLTVGRHTVGATGPGMPVAWRDELASPGAFFAWLQVPPEYGTIERRLRSRHFGSTSGTIQVEYFDGVFVRLRFAIQFRENGVYQNPGPRTASVEGVLAQRVERSAVTPGGFVVGDPSKAPSYIACERR